MAHTFCNSRPREKRFINQEANISAVRAWVTTDEVLHFCKRIPHYLLRDLYFETGSFILTFHTVMHNLHNDSGSQQSKSKVILSLLSMYAINTKISKDTYFLLFFYSEKL